MEHKISFKEFGQRLKQAREALGLTQGGLGEKIGLKWYQIQHLELGKAKKIPIDFPGAVESLGISAKWLATGEGQMLKSVLIETSPIEVQPPLTGEAQIKPPIPLRNLVKMRMKGWIEDFCEKASDEQIIGLEEMLKRLYPEYQVWEKLQKEACA
ncbi:MAG: helix-turn-helix transcriptional regulator [Nitrospinae bacterium]|nr:helix-turn-helix transcriptional regulator [Nitrospinota bacterium]